MLLRKPRTIITGIITTGIMGVAAPTGTTIALTGRGEVPARRQLVEPFWLRFCSDFAAAQRQPFRSVDNLAAIREAERSSLLDHHAIKKFNLPAGGLRSPAQVYILPKKVPSRGLYVRSRPRVRAFVLLR